VSKRETVSSAVIEAAGRRMEKRRYHQDRAEDLLRKAEEWIDVDEATLTERGYGMAMVWIDLAVLHLALRKLIQ
jgi:hypothetical protein